MAAHTTKESVANYLSVAEESIADEWIVQVSAFIDAWRGDLYPPAPEEFTETLDGDGGRMLFLDHLQVDSVTSVTMDGDALDTGQYYVKNGSTLVRTQPEGAVVPYYTWNHGLDNIEVVGMTKSYGDLLEGTANAIIAYFHARNKLDGLLRVYPRRIREFTEGGGAITGHDALEETIVLLLKAYLPRPSLVR